MNRPLAFLTTALAAMSIAASPALADMSVSGSLGDSLSASMTGSAGGPASTSTASSTLTVTGPTVSAVTVYINGKKVQTATNASVDGSYTLTVDSKRLRRARSAQAV